MSLKKLSGILLGDVLEGRFASAAFWSAIGSGLSWLSNLLSSIILARLFGRVLFGELGIITETIGVLGIFAGLGLGLTATKYVAEFKNTDPDKAGKVLSTTLLFVMLISSLISIGFFFSSTLVASRILNAVRLSEELKVASGMLFFVTLNGSITGALAGFEGFRSIAVLNLVKGISKFSLSIVGGWFLDVIGVVIGMICAELIVFLVGVIMLSRECKAYGLKISILDQDFHWSILARFSFPAFLSGVISRPAIWLSNAVIANQSGGYSELGLLNAVNQWKVIVISFSAILYNSSLPILSEKQGMGDEVEESFKDLINTSQSLAILITLPLSSVLMFLSGWIMDWYGREFVAGVPVFIGIVYGITLAALNSPVAAEIAAEGKMWFGALQNLSWGIIMFSSVFLLAPRWGAKSFAFGFSLAYFVLLLWSYWFLRGKLPRGMVSRTYKTSIYLLILALIALFLSQRVRSFLVIPILFLSLYLSLFKFISVHTRSLIYDKFTWVKSILFAKG